jgi:hypothetical protein
MLEGRKMFISRTYSEGGIEKFEILQRNVRKCNTIILGRIKLRSFAFDRQASVLKKTAKISKMNSHFIRDLDIQQSIY